jgi:hypothetical protein
LHAVPELAENVRGHVLRGLRHEEHADALRADEPHGLDDGLDERLARAVEQQVRLVEKKTRRGLSRSPILGQLLEELGDEPHEHGGPEGRLVLDGRELEARDDPAAVGRRAEQVGHVELWLAEELRAAARLESDERPEENTDRLWGEAADPFSSTRPASESRKVRSARRSERSSSGRPFSSA